MSTHEKHPKFTIFIGKDKKFHWNLTSGKNGNIILRSVRGFASKQNAKKNISYVIKQGINKENYCIETANISGTGYYYYLLGKNGTMLAISGNGKNYKSINWQIAQAGASKGILSCVKNIPMAAKKEF